LRIVIECILQFPVIKLNEPVVYNYSLMSYQSMVKLMKETGGLLTW